jgi:hypothetical protein
MTEDDSYDWKPISEADLARIVDDETPRYNPVAERLWDAIRIPPRKWQLHPWGDLGGGFWVVAIYGRNVVWYNDIEEGFNTSPWSTPGVIDAYFCDQAHLRRVIASLCDSILDGSDMPPKLGPPRPGLLGG